MKIVFFTNSFLPRLCGSSISIANLASALTDYGHEVYVFAPEYRSFISNRAKEQNILRVPSIRFYKRLAAPLISFCKYKIKDILSDISPDIIHIHQPFLMGMLGVKEAEDRQIPIVYTYHTFYGFYVHYAVILKKLLKRILEYRTLEICQIVDHIIVPTSIIYSYLQKKSINTAITVIPSGVIKKNYREPDRLTKKKLRRNYGIREQQPLLLYVGRICKEKNLSFLCKVISILYDLRPDIITMFVGSGPQKQSLRRQIKRRGCESVVRWVDEQQPHNLPLFYYTADIFVFPSISDTQAMVLYEALYANLPIVAVNSMASRAAIKSEINGMLTSCIPSIFAFEILRCLSQYQRFCIKNNDNKSFDMDFTVQQHIKLYNSLIR